MAALLANAPRLRALQDSLRSLDPESAKALNAFIDSAENADAVLRECGIQLAALQTLQVANRTPAGFTMALRDQVDALIGAVPAPQPVSQDDDE